MKHQWSVYVSNEHGDLTLVAGPEDLRDYIEDPEIPKGERVTLEEVIAEDRMAVAVGSIAAFDAAVGGDVRRIIRQREEQDA